MKKNFLAVLIGCFFMMLAVCGSAQATEPKFSDYFSGRLEMGVSVDSIDVATGIRAYDGLGGKALLTLVVKKQEPYDLPLPAGAYFTAGYRTDVEGSNDPLAKIFSVGAGWTSSNDPNMPQISFGVDRLDLHEFGDVANFHIAASKPLWKALETYYVSAIFHLEGTAPISGDKCLHGANAGATLRFAATADQHLSLVQEVRVSADDGSDGRLPAGLLSYAIYGKIQGGDFEFIFPRVTCVYSNENGCEDRYALRREEQMAMIDFAVARKF